MIEATTNFTSGNVEFHETVSIATEEIEQIVLNYLTNEFQATNISIDSIHVKIGPNIKKDIIEVDPVIDDIIVETEPSKGEEMPHSHIFEKIERNLNSVRFTASQQSAIDAALKNLNALRAHLKRQEDELKASDEKANESKKTEAAFAIKECTMEEIIREIQIRGMPTAG